MGFGVRVRERLFDALRAEGEGLKRAALSIGGMIEFDPVVALTRDAPPNRQCRLIKAVDGWIAVNLAREDDVASVPAWLGCSVYGDVWGAIEAAAGRQPTASLLQQAILLGMPVAVVGEAVLESQRPPDRMSPNATPKVTANAARVLDLSSLWAGPYCGALLSEAGMQVTKVESLSRADPMRSELRLNGAKRHKSLSLSDPALTQMIAESEMLLTSARPHALARLGLTEARLFELNPILIWVAITAYGWTGNNAMRVGFGDDCAAAGGLVAWEDGVPSFIGDALADPITGIAAATAAMEWMAEGKSGLIDMSLAGCAAKIRAAINAPVG